MNLILNALIASSLLFRLFYSKYRWKALVGLKKSSIFATLLEKGTTQTECTFGRLAQLVQSICLTSRGSAVRIRQRPHILSFFNCISGV